MKTYLCTFMVIHRLILVRMRNISAAVFRKKENTFRVQQCFFPPKIEPFIVELFCGVRQTTDNNTIHPRKDAIFMSSNEDKEKTQTRIILTAFPRQQSLRGSCECYVARTFPVLSLQSQSQYMPFYLFHSIYSL